MILSVLWTEILYLQAQTKSCHRTLIMLLHYLAKANRSEGLYLSNFSRGSEYWSQ